jgi:hypothetical protein
VSRIFSGEGYAKKEFRVQGSRFRVEIRQISYFYH